MVGVTLYVSITTEESVKIDQDYPVMKCFYGYSFLCAVLSFVLQELTGVLTVYWFIFRFRALVRKQEKLRERTRQLMGNCLSMTTALPLNFASFGPGMPQQSQTSSNSLAPPQQRRRIPFDKSYVNSLSPTNYPQMISPPRSPTLIYGDYCRVLIRAEDMHLLSQMVKSKSQGQYLPHSRPTTPASKSQVNCHPITSTVETKSRRSTRRGVKRTTSV
jgi:hypothetical protein